MERAALIRFLGTVFEARESEIVCSEFFELLPAYVDLVASSGAPAAPGGVPAGGSAYRPVLGVRRGVPGPPRDHAPPAVRSGAPAHLSVSRHAARGD